MGEVDRVMIVNMLKPYYIKADNNHVRIILAYRYFSILINNQLYHYVPSEANEIKVNRETKEIVNLEAKFAFQKGKDIVYLTMTELISLPDFLIQLYFIVESYYAQTEMDKKEEGNPETIAIIEELERQNIKRFIDKALDEKDAETFHELVKYL